MKKRIILPLHPDIVNIEKRLAEMSELNEILRSTGVVIDMECDSVIIECDTDRIEYNKSRGAGRKMKITAQRVTCAEIAGMRETMKEHEILSQLGISRSTYYRRLRRLKTAKPDSRF